MKIAGGPHLAIMSYRQDTICLEKGKSDQMLVGKDS